MTMDGMRLACSVYDEIRLFRREPDPVHIMLSMQEASPMLDPVYNFHSLWAPEALFGKRRDRPFLKSGIYAWRKSRDAVGIFAK